MTDKVLPPWMPKGGLTPWLKRRASNARRRRSLLAAVTAPVAVVSLAIFLYIPHSARRAAREMVPRTTERPDTAGLRRALAGATTRLAVADDRLAQARTELQQSHQAAHVDTLSAEQRVRRQALTAGTANLARLLQRVESAPLPASYRALGESPELRGDSRIKRLLDSLAVVEKSREAFGATGGVDPVFIALTARATEIGEVIRQRAEAKRLAMRTELARLAAPPAPPQVRPPVDTLPLAIARDSAVRSVAQARTALSRARALLRAIDDSTAQANRVAAVGASFPAMFGAALVIGLAIAFAAAFVDEARRPRVADDHEAEDAGGVPVLARLRMPSNPPERTRRRSDREISPLIERTGESYEPLLTQVMQGAGGLHPVVIAGDEPEVSAIVAANLASVSAHRARTTLLVDLDLDERSIAGVLRIPATPGVADLLSTGTDWPALVRQVMVGRDRHIDVISSGHFTSAEISDLVLQQLSRELTHMRGRYDAVILHVPEPGPGVLRLLGKLGAPVAVCTRIAGTQLVSLSNLVASIREAGAPVSGIVAWESDLPILAVSSVTPTTPMRAVVGVGESW